MEAKARTGLYYKNARGEEPAMEFIKALAFDAKAKILTRIERACRGNFADAHGVGDGVSELRIDYGPGYRVYYSIVEGNTIVLWLEAGSKKGQQADIDQAKENLKDYLKQKSKPKVNEKPKLKKTSSKKRKNKK